MATGFATEGDNTLVDTLVLEANNRAVELRRALEEQNAARQAATQTTQAPSISVNVNINVPFTYINGQDANQVIDILFSRFILNACGHNCYFLSILTIISIRPTNLEKL